MSGADHERFARALLPLRDEATDKRAELLAQYQRPGARRARWLGWALMLALAAGLAWMIAR